MKPTGYDVTFSNSVGHVFSRRFSDFEIFMKHAEFYITSGYTVFVTPVYDLN